MSASLYHYTTFAGLFGILNTRSFWLSKSSFMNDPGELTYAWNIYYQEIARLGDKFDNIFTPLVRWVNSILEVQDFYLLSLSGEKDSLSLWQRYTKTSGLALEIDTDRLLEEIGKSSHKNNFNGLHQVYYDQDFQSKVVKVNIEKYISAQSVNKGYPIDSETTAGIKMDVLSSIFAFKHGAFRDESEVRAVFWIPNLKSLVVRKNWQNAIRFRIQAERIVPYMEIDLQTFSWLRSIVLGPSITDSIKKEGLSLFLGSKNIDIPVVDSSAPYRE